MTSTGMPTPAFIGAYPVIQELGSGAFGTVYLAKHPSVDAQVAIKAFNRIQASDTVLRAQLHQEIRALMAVRSPYCLQVTDVIDTPEVLAFVTEYIRGATLRTLLDQHHRLSGPMALNVLWGAAQGLAAVHDAGLVHGDVKPANILVAENGASRIIDFGLASAPGHLRGDELAPYGSPAYASPEQLQYGYRDARSDIYSLSVTLFELLTGQRPFSGRTVAEFTQAQAEHPVPDPRTLAPELGPDLASLVMHGMSKDPSQRPQDMAAYLAWFQHAATATYGETWRTPGELGGLVAGLMGAGVLASGVLIAATSGATALAGGVGVAGSAGTVGVWGSTGGTAAASGTAASSTSVATGVGSMLTAKVAAIAVGTVVAVGAATGGTVYAINSSNDTTSNSSYTPPTPQPTVPSIPTYIPSPTEAIAPVAVDCTSDPQFTLSNVSSAQSDGSVAVTYNVAPASACPSGQWLGASQYEVSVSDNGTTYLDGYFDFSQDPVWIPQGGTTFTLTYAPTDVYGDSSDLQAVDQDSSNASVAPAAGPGSSDNSANLPAPADSSTGQGTTTLTSMSDLPPNAESEAQATLDRWIQRDQAQLDALQGQWIPQVSSGIVGVGGTTSLTQLVADHLKREARYPGTALLLNATSWAGTYGPSFHGYYVTVVNQSYAQAGSVLAWCHSQHYGKGQCWAVRLRHGGHPANNQVNP